MRAILTYHSIDASRSPVSIDPDVFAAHVTWLASGAVEVLSIDQLLRAPAGAPAVALTFDDALVSFAERAWPLLSEHRLPVTLFVPTGRVGGTNRWSGREEPGIPTLRLLDWPALQELARQGATLGAHGVRHRDLTRLDDTRLLEELREPALELARRTGAKPGVLAYPYGRVDRRVAAAAARFYPLACTTELRPLRPAEEPLLLPRIDAWYLRRPGLLERWGTTALRSYLALRATARRGRSALRRLAPSAGA